MKKINQKTELRDISMELLEKEVEISSLKCSIGGYVTANKNYVKKIDELKSMLAKADGELKHIKAMYEELKNKYSIVEANYDYVCSLPWYKRIFYKK